MNRRSFIKGSTMAGVAGLFSSDAVAKLTTSGKPDLLIPDDSKRKFTYNKNGKFKILQITLVEKVKTIENIQIVTDVSAYEYIIEDDNLTGVKFKNTKTNELLTLNAKGCFIAIGQIPDNKIIKDLVDLDNQGFVIANESCLTKTEGLFVCGDCRTKEVRQVTTATSDGAVAATQAVKYLNK